MPRARDPNRDRALAIWQEHGGGITNRLIAEQLGVNEKVIAVWKQRDRWNVVQQTESNVVQQTVRRKGGPPKGSKNAIGNRGGSAPKRNVNAVTHGFFRKFLPDDPETREIYDAVDQISPLDLLWEQIKIKVTAIIRAQPIMYVESKDEMIKELKKRKYEVVPTAKGDFRQIPTEEEYEFQFAWDRKATFLNAQARAMSTLASMIRQYEEMCRLTNADEEQQLRIQKLKAEVTALNKETMPDPVSFKDDLHE